MPVETRVADVARLAPHAGRYTARYLHLGEGGERVRHSRRKLIRIQRLTCGHHTRLGAGDGDDGERQGWSSTLSFCFGTFSTNRASSPVSSSSESTAP